MADMSRFASFAFLLALLGVLPACQAVDTTRPTEPVGSPQSMERVDAAGKLKRLGFYDGRVVRPKPPELDAALAAFRAQVARLPDADRLQLGTGLDPRTLALLEALDGCDARQSARGFSVDADCRARRVTPLVEVYSAPPPGDMPGAGDTVLVRDTTECFDGGEGFLTYCVGEVGEVRRTGVEVRLEERYALRFDPEKTGVSDTDWFCAPKQRYCYSRVDFGDWKGTRTAGEVDVFGYDRVMIGERTPIDLARRDMVPECSAELDSSTS